jgi:diaminohydroxyphosphoribosylaminopyrimidine deaminase / 5-amino-6-(5-phosphoribosylamino)uracil reductase
MKAEVGHTVWMGRALELAAKGEGRTRPNPPVGAVLVRGGQVVGEGYHRKAGGPHAEIEALQGLTRAQTRGAILYVTLEPCCTHGRTPPCTDAIEAAGIAEVVVSVKDPNPLHAGRGLRLLRKHGVRVLAGVCKEEGEALLAPFAKWITTGRPFVTLKMAMTLDGRIGDAQRCSRWITGDAARREVQQLRRRVDAVLVGAGTVVSDNPSLLVKAGKNQQPLRVVLDGAGRIALDAKVLTDGQSTVVVVTDACPAKRLRALERSSVRVWRCGEGDRVDLAVLLERLGQDGCLHVLCEGGGELAGALLRENLVDCCRFYIAGRLLGGDGVPVTGSSGWLLGEAPHLQFTGVRKVGRDVCLTAEPLRREVQACLRD